MTFNKIWIVSVSFLLAISLVGKVNAGNSFDEQIAAQLIIMKDLDSKLKKRGSNLEEYMEATQYLNEMKRTIPTKGPVDAGGNQRRFFIKEVRDDDTMDINPDKKEVWLFIGSLVPELNKVMKEEREKYKDGIQYKLLELMNKVLKDPKLKWSKMVRTLLLADYDVNLVYLALNGDVDNMDDIWFVNPFTTEDVYKKGWF